MSREYAYYPGCTLHTTAREYDTSFRLVCEALKIGLQEPEGWICCGASSAHATSRLLALALPAHTLLQVNGSGLEIVAPCAMCFSRLKVALHELEDKGLRKQVSQVLGREVGNLPAVWHPLQMLDREKIEVKKPLKGLKVACYYGCLLVRPKGIAQFDDLENPQSMDRLVAAAGAEPVPWAFKTECCGAGMPLARHDIVLKLSHRIISQARQAGADCLVVACPMCHSNLDLYQKEMRANFGDSRDMPVLYFSQLLGLALGFSPAQMLFKRHFADPLPMLREKGLI